MEIRLRLMSNKLPFYHLIRKSTLENIPSPLLIMVHGYGSNEKDLFSFSRAIPSHITIVSLRGDIEIQNNSYAWYNISLDFNGNKSYDITKAQESRDRIVTCIDQCVETYNIEIKKDEQDYFNHRQTHYDKMNPEYLSKNTCEFTQFKNKLDDKSIGSLDGGRFDPSLLTAFRKNPYTQSLESFAY